MGFAIANHAEIAPPVLKTDWTLWESEVLVDCSLKHQLVTVFRPETGDSHQSFIHGFDLDSAQLLLDGLYPWPVQALQTAEQFWLQITTDEGYYNLRVQVKELDGRRHRELLTVDVLESTQSQNRRWDTRVYFPQRQGPRVDILPDDQAQVTAYVANLSRRGALLEIYGQDIKLAVGRRMTGLFRFNDHFHLPLQAKIFQCRFLRRPCCHTSIRVQFQRLDADTQARLDTFLHAVTSTAEPAPLLAGTAGFAVA